MKEVYILSIQDAERIPVQYCMDNFPVRMKRSAAFRKKNDRLRCIGAGALLHGEAGIREEEITYNEYGKPLCEGKYFSISHGGDVIILAVADTYIGADVEKITRRHGDIRKRVFTEAESELVRDDESFFRLWTLKESIMKAEGKGFAMDPRTFEVMPLLEGGSVNIGDREYFAECFRIDGHMISVVSGSQERAGIKTVKTEMLWENDGSKTYSR